MAGSYVYIPVLNILNYSRLDRKYSLFTDGRRQRQSHDIIHTTDGRKLIIKTHVKKQGDVICYARYIVLIFYLCSLSVRYLNKEIF